jgi:putative hemolysin
MDGQLWQLVTIGVLVLISGLCSGTEIALVSLRSTQIERLGGGTRRERSVATLAADPNRFLATLQIGTTLAGFLASAIGAVSLAEPLVEVFAPLGALAQPAAILLVTGVLTYVTLVLGELAPKRIAMQRAEGWAVLVAPAIDLISRLLRPVIWVLSVSIDAVVRAAGTDPAQAREELGVLELQQLIAAPGVVPDSHQEVLLGAMEVTTRTVREVMVPRLDVVALSEDLTAADALDALLEQGYSRAPVYAEGLDDADRTISVVALARADGRVADHSVEASVLPESLPVLDALRQLQAAERRLAIVLSEHGGVEGIVTVEDLVEEIVGELRDEHDRDHPEVRHLPDGGLQLSGRFPLTDLADVGVEFDHAALEATSLGGVFAEVLGRLPRRGDRVTVQGFELEALGIRRRAVTEVALRADAGAGPGADRDAGPDAGPDADPDADRGADPDAGPDSGVDGSGR